MTWTRHFISAVALLASFAAVTTTTGCDRETSDTRQTVEPWLFQSKIAPYSIEVPGKWQKTPTGEINQFADIVLTVDERFAAGEPFRLIVIPQELPQYEGVPSPDARALKRASLSLLRKRVDDFEVQREGPLTLDGEPALSVFAEGMDNHQPVQYITSYATHGDFGYQIVAWGPRKQQDGLVAAVDELLAGWQFTDDANSPEPADESKGSSDAASVPAQP